MKLLNDEISVNYGAVYENLVAQELSAHGFGGIDHCIYYFSSKRQGELDFVIEHEGHVVPIEVKSGKDYERHNALSNVMSNADYTIERAYVLCSGNMETRGRIVYAPIYMTMFIEKKQRVQSQIFRIDMTGLR